MYVLTALVSGDASPSRPRVLSARRTRRAAADRPRARRTALTLTTLQDACKSRLGPGDPAARGPRKRVERQDCSAGSPLRCSYCSRPFPSWCRSCDTDPNLATRSQPDRAVLLFLLGVRWGRSWRQVDPHRTGLTLVGVVLVLIRSYWGIARRQRPVACAGRLAGNGQLPAVSVSTTAPSTRQLGFACAPSAKEYARRSPPTSPPPSVTAVEAAQPAGTSALSPPPPASSTFPGPSSSSAAVEFKRGMAESVR